MLWIIGLLAGLVASYLALLIAQMYSQYYQALFAAAEVEAEAESEADSPIRLAFALPALHFDLRTGLLLAALTAWVAWLIGSQGWQATTLTGVVVPGLLVTICLIDFAVRRIPNHLVFALLIWAGIQLMWMPFTPVDALIGALIGFGLFFALAQVRRGGIGFGDVKLAGAIGALVGLAHVINAMLIGIIAGGVAAFVLILLRRVGRKSTMAYGPYLALGCWWTIGVILGVW